MSFLAPSRLLEFVALPKTDRDLATARFRVVAVSALLALLVALVCARQPWSAGWTAWLLAVFNIGLFLAHSIIRRDAAFARLIGFGLILGLGELVADALCVLYTGTLDYSVARSPMLWLSPVWMPLAWLCISVQIGYWGALLTRRFGLVRGAAITALIGAVNIPFYEQMAFHTHWWQYRNCLMWNHAPVYVIVAELFIGFCLAPLAVWALRGPRIVDAVYAGLCGGLATIAGGLIGYGLIERIPRWLGFQF